MHADPSVVSGGHIGRGLQRTSPQRVCKKVATAGSAALQASTSTDRSEEKKVDHDEE